MIKKTIEGFPMYLNPGDGGISGALAAKGGREPCFMWLLRREARGDLGLDIGGNIGYTTLSLCKGMNRVIAIEPDRRSRKLLKKNIKLNGFGGKTTIHSFAVSNKMSESTIYLSDKPNLTTLCKPQADHHKKETISTITIDSLDLLPNFMKMDIEGYEVEALQGARETLRNTQSCKILIEVHPMFYSRDRDLRAVLKGLISDGYVIKYVISAGVPVPDLFSKYNYSPLSGAPIARRAIYDCVSQDHALDWSTRVINQKLPNGKTSPKIVRAIMLEK